MELRTIAVEWLTSETLRTIERSLALTGAMQKRHYGRIIRVPRRGFRRDVRRGDDLPWRASTDGLAHVVRRSRHSLWLEIDRPRFGGEGAMVDVRLPQRYRA